MHLEVLGDKEKAVFKTLTRFSDFYLAGGTALALQMGHRISIDFDLFSPDEISKGELPRVKRVFAPSPLVVSVNNRDELTVFMDNIKITFLRYPFPVVLGLVEYDGVKLLSGKELTATKAYTIGRRGSFKDYVDLYFAIIDGIATLLEIIELAEKKYGSDFNTRLFLEQLIYLEDIDDQGIVFIKPAVHKAELEKFFKEQIKSLHIL